jgi:hypothetical protein
MIINKEYFEIEDIKFRGIKKETFKFIEIFEGYFVKNTKYTYKFEDFMVTLANHLNRNGFSIKKIEKWFKSINTNIQSLAKKALENKNETNETI